MSGKKRLMLVEDEMLIALAETRQLERAGYNVLHVTTGEAAVQAVQDQAVQSPAQPVDLILMDIDLGPGIDGTEAATQILQIAEIPLVFLSSHTEKEYTERTEQITSYGYIVKNSGETVLLASIKMAFKLFDAHMALRENEERFRSIVESAPEPIFIQTNHRFAYLNPAAVQLLGAGTPEELVGAPIMDRVAAEFREVAQERVQALNENRTPVRNPAEQKWVRLDGQEIWVETTGEPYEYQGQSGALVFVRDRTEHKRQVEESEWWHRLMQYVLQHDPNAVAILDRDLHFMYVSERFVRDYQLTDSEIIGRHHYEVFPDTPERWKAAHQRALAGVVSAEDNDLYTRSDGSVDHTRWECRPWFQMDGSVGGIVLYTEVLTELRQEQERHRQSEERYRTFVDHLPGIVYTYSTKRGGLFWAKPVESILGYSPEEIQSNPFLWNQAIHPDDVPRVQQAIESHAAGADYNVEYRIKTRDGRWVWLQDRFIHKTTTDEETLIHGFAIDVTDRKLAEIDLASSKRYLETILETSADGFWVVAPDRRFSTVNEAYLKMSGYSREELLDLTINDIDAIEDPGETTARIARIMDRGFDIFETQHRRKDGSLFDVEVSVTPFDRSDGTHLVCFCRDISERKATRLQLEEQTSLLNTVMDNMLDLVAITDLNGVLSYVGRSHQQLGYRVEDLIGTNVLTPVHPEDKERVTEQFASFQQTGISAPVEYRWARADGTYVWLETWTRLLPDQSGRPARVLFNTRDVTERRKNEEALKREQQRLAAIIEGTDVGTWEWNVQTGETRFNRRWAEIVGYTLEEISPVSIATWERFTEPSDLKISAALLERHFRGESPGYEFEGRMRHKNGSWVWVLDRGRVITRDDAGNPLMMMGTHLDITERKYREERHQRLAEVSRTLNEYTHESIDYREIAEIARELSGAAYVVFNRYEPDGVTLSTVALAGISDVTERISSILGFSPVGRRWDPDPGRTAQLTQNRITIFDSLKEFADGNMPARVVATIQRVFRLGPVVLLAITRDERPVGDLTLFFEAGAVLSDRAVMELFADMVALVMIRVELEKGNALLLQEKETLLREVQHRIKNTLNTMGSLLSLQAGTLEEPQALAAVNDIRSRFAGMEVLYDQLYRSEVQGAVSVHTYMTRLVPRVIGMFPHAGEVEVSLDIAEFSLDAKRLSALGLIVNELVTNVMKYAFRNKKNGGRVQVRCTNNSGGITLTVADNGAGMPAAVRKAISRMESGSSMDLSSFGITIILSLTHQLNGTIAFQHDGGTTVTISFPA